MQLLDWARKVLQKEQEDKDEDEDPRPPKRRQLSSRYPGMAITPPYDHRPSTPSIKYSEVYMAIHKCFPSPIDCMRSPAPSSDSSSVSGDLVSSTENKEWSRPGSLKHKRIGKKTTHNEQDEKLKSMKRKEGLLRLKVPSCGNSQSR